MSPPKHDSYRDSGIEWIGEIPAHWDIRRIKSYALIKRGASPRPIADPRYFDEQGEYGWVRIEDVTKSNKYLFETKQYLSNLGISHSIKQHDNDLFLSIAGSVGKPIISKIKCCIHDGFVWFDWFNDINKEFLFYIFLSGLPFIGLGKHGTQLNLNTATIGDIKIPVPSSEEQEKIVEFLDCKTSEIDQAIAQKQRLIELLQEQKAILINQAVTKGLNPNTPMRDSGIKWLGKIPKRWKVSSLKHAWEIIDCKHLTAPFTDEGYPLASIQEVQSKRINLERANRTNEKFYRKLIEGGRRPKIGDIIYSRNATVGAASLVDFDEEFALGQDVCLLRSSQNNGSFFVHQLRADVVLGQLNQLLVGSTFNRINISQIKELIVCVPPVEEQKNIDDYVNEIECQIDEVINGIRKEQQVLRELSKVFIAEAVTGKIKL